MDNNQQNQNRFNNYRIVYIALVAVIIILSGVLGWLVYTKLLNSQSSTKNQSTSSNITTGSTELSKIEIPDSINPIDAENLPLGINKYTATAPKSGYIYSCQANFSSDAGGAEVAGPWINEAKETWNSKQKVAVSGSVAWPNAEYKMTINESSRIINGNNLPINSQTTGTYPILATDLAYRYDKNPNKITSQTISWTLPLSPTKISGPKCVNMGAIGILEDGVVLFNALDGMGRDAAAYETLDSCEGHPERTSEYHHHNIASCIISKYTEPNSSSLVGYAIDGYGIYVERDKNGNLLTNENLDECHGRTSDVMWDGKIVNMYHYNATMEFPYTIGCFAGAPAVTTTLEDPTTQNRPPRPPAN